MPSNLERMTIAQMRGAALAWRVEDLRHRDTEATRSTHDRISELIDEIARLRDLEIVVSAVTPAELLGGKSHE